MGVVALLTAIMRIKGFSAKGRKIYLRFIWTPKYKKAFQDLKDTFTKALILAYFIPGQQLYLKINSLNHVNVGVLS